MLYEVDEWHARPRKVRQKLARHRRGSEAYLDLLPDLSVELEWLKLKAESAALTLEEYEESLPDGDCAAVRYVPPAPTFSSSAPVADHISSWSDLPWVSMVTMATKSRASNCHMASGTPSSSSRWTPVTRTRQRA